MCIRGHSGLIPEYELEHHADYILKNKPIGLGYICRLNDEEYLEYKARETALQILREFTRLPNEEFYWSDVSVLAAQLISISKKNNAI